MRRWLKKVKGPYSKSVGGVLISLTWAFPVLGSKLRVHAT